MLFRVWVLRMFVRWYSFASSRPPALSSSSSFSFIFRAGLYSSTSSTSFSFHPLLIFSRDKATLYDARSVGLSVRNHFTFCDFPGFLYLCFSWSISPSVHLSENRVTTQSTITNWGRIVSCLIRWHRNWCRNQTIGDAAPRWLSKMVTG